MCSILGIWDFKNKIDEAVLRRMNNVLRHRGPDDEGVFLSSKANVGLAHNRLAILDLSPAGHQPMQAGDCWLVFNGEVYNFKEIRKELEQKGHSFFSNSDTEVILKSYTEWGIGSVERFRGMFAYCLLDEKKEKMFLARDRAGIKPLYYYWDGNLLVFASEIKAILQHPQVKNDLNFSGLSLFLQMGYVPCPYSIFKNVFKLEPGHFLEIDSQRNLKKTKYWDVFAHYLKQLDKNPQRPSEPEAQEKLEALLCECLKLRMVSDVEVGMFLSGGIDSSTVAALLTKKLGFNNLKTFTIGFKEKEYNEAEYAKKVALHLGTEHNELYCSAKQAIDLIPKIVEVYDEPFGDNSALPTYLLAQFTRNYVKVSLSADGGDEAFAGYDRYWVIDKLFRKLKLFKGPFLKAGVSGLKILTKAYPLLAKFLPEINNLKAKIAKIERRINKLNLLQKYPRNIISFYQLLGFGFWNMVEVANLISESNLIDACDYLTGLFPDERLSELDNISQMQLLDYKTYMSDDILVKVDRATMAFGLEARDPLLDHKIIEYMAGLPVDFKYRNNVSKHLLRKILYKYVPRDLLERPKQGFSIPLENWLKTDLKYLFDDYLSEARIKKEGIFNWEIIKQEKEKFLNSKISQASHLWLLIVFEMWKERWLAG